MKKKIVLQTEKHKRKIANKTPSNLDFCSYALVAAMVAPVLSMIVKPAVILDTERWRVLDDKTIYFSFDEKAVRNIEGFKMASRIGTKGRENLRNFLQEHYVSKGWRIQEIPEKDTTISCKTNNILVLVYNVPSQAKQLLDGTKLGPQTDSFGSSKIRAITSKVVSFIDDSLELESLPSKTKYQLQHELLHAIACFKHHSQITPEDLPPFDSRLDSTHTIMSYNFPPVDKCIKKIVYPPRRIEESHRQYMERNLKDIISKHDACYKHVPFDLTILDETALDLSRDAHFLGKQPDLSTSIEIGGDPEPLNTSISNTSVAAICCATVLVGVVIAAAYRCGITTPTDTQMHTNRAQASRSKGSRKKH